MRGYACRPPSREALRRGGFATTDLSAPAHAGRVYYVKHKPWYRALGVPDHPHRRAMSMGRAIERVMVLDGVPLSWRLTLRWATTLTDPAHWVCWDTTDNGACDTMWWPNGGATTKPLESLAPGTHYWQVRADTTVGPVYGDNGTWWRFTVGSEPEADGMPMRTADTPGPRHGRASAGEAAASGWWRAGVGAGVWLLCGVVLGFGVCTRWRLARRWAVAAWVCALALGLAVPAAGQTGTRVEYYHLDALGSVRVVTGANGQVLRRHDYRPFGEEVTPAHPNPDRKLFTGQERDPETGLDYFGARYYRADIGRFTTIDPGHASASPDDPQSWNAYSYARNNPLKYVDPDGRRWFTKNGNAVWVDPNKDGSYTSPGEGWVELDPKNYDYGMNVAFVNGQLSRIGEDAEGHKMLAPWMTPEQGLADTTFSFLAPIQAGAAAGVGVGRMLAANRLPSIGFKLLTPAEAFTKDLVRLAIVRQVMLKQIPIGQVVKGVIVLEGRTVSYTAFRRVTGEIVVTSIRAAK